MDRNILDALCCPICKKDLIADDLIENAFGQIIEGALFCDTCKISYKIIDGIPILLNSRLTKPANNL